MRHVLPLLFVFAGTFVVVACSSDETKAPEDAGTIAPLGDGGGGGDDDDDVRLNQDCKGATGFDCTKLTAHAKEAGCSKFDEEQFEKDCDATNCDTPLQCEKAEKALGDCLFAEPNVCAAGGALDPQVPAACDGANRALFDCLTES